jgi:hypothetical protein
VNITIKLTSAQHAALQCREGGGLEPNEFPIVVAGWKGSRLTFAADDMEALLSELGELSNAEDAQAEQQGDAGARGAALALSNLSTKALKAWRATGR